MVNNFDQNDELNRRNLKNIDNEKFKEALTSTNFKQVLPFYCSNPNISLGLLFRKVCYFNSNYPENAEKV